MGAYELTWRAITSGVPLGSVLGPLLFVILPDKIKNIFEMYADDRKVISEVGNTNETSLESHINEIKKWCTRWSMCWLLGSMLSLDVF